MRFIIPSDDTIIQLSHKDSKGDMVFKYLNSKTNKKELTLTKEQLDKNLRTEIFKELK